MRDHAHDVSEGDRDTSRVTGAGNRRPQHALLALQAFAGNGNVTQMLRETGHAWAQKAGGPVVQRSPTDVKAPDADLEPVEESPAERKTPTEVTAPDLGLKGGQESHSKLGKDTRMLNRMARFMMDAPRGTQGMSLSKVGTPHLALTVIDDKVHIAGNSGLEPDHKDAALKRLDANKVRQAAKAGDHDAKKLVELLDGKYSDTANGSFGAIESAAVKPESMQWHNLHKPSKGVIHGEMALLDEIAQEMRRKARSGDGELQDWPIAGRKRDCLPCHWAFAIFNTHIAKPLGYRITSSGSHGGGFLNWKMPKWMVDNAATKGAMTAKLKEERMELGKGYTLKTEVKKGTAHEFNPPAPRSDEPYLSDSSVDGESSPEQATSPEPESQAAPVTDPAPASAGPRRGGNRNRNRHRNRNRGGGPRKTEEES